MKITIMKVYTILLLFWILSLSIPSCGQPEMVTLGIYGSPEPFWERGYELKDLGVNAVFVHSGTIDQQMVERTHVEGIKIFAEFATLNGKNYVKNHPDAWPINQNGQKANQASWFMGVCPTNTEFRNYKMEELRNLLKSYDLDGVWLDYIHWHAQFEEPEPILPETCFCPSCLSEFENSTDFLVPGNSISEKAHWILEHKDPEWREWRCSVIRSWVMEIRDIIRHENPGILLGIYHCPWEDDEFNGARRRILGLDFDLLRNIVDVFSPMVYHGRMGRSAEWVKNNIEWFCKRLKIDPESYPKVWPIVQAYDDPTPISPEEFEKVLSGAMTSASTGVMMFTGYAVAQRKEKIKVMKQVYRKEGK